MAHPSWFNDTDYLASKLAQLKAAGLGHLYTHTDQVKVAIAGINLTAFEHFSQFHMVEGTSPNQLFNAYEYLTAKAASLNAAGVEGGAWTIERVDAAFKANGLSAWEHFQQFGWKEGVNPSNHFDVAAYLNAKVVQLQQAIPGEAWTVEKVKAAFEANGFDPISHYEASGKAEGVPAAPVAADQRVDDDPRDAGSHAALSATEAQVFIGTAQNDTVTAASVAALQGPAGGHTLIDNTTTDRDVLRVTAAEAKVALGDTKVTGFEVLDVTWQEYADAEVDLTGFHGLQELHLAIDQVGNLGGAEITGLSNTTVVLGSGVTGKVVVTAADATASGTILTGRAKEVVFQATWHTSKGAATVTGGADVVDITVGSVFSFQDVTVTAGVKTEMINARAFKTANVTTGAATTVVHARGATIDVDASVVSADGVTINLVGVPTGGDDRATVTLGESATVKAMGLGDRNDTLTLDVAAGKTVTVTEWVAKTVVKGRGDVVLTGTQTVLNDQDIAKSNAGTLTVAVDGALGGVFDTARIGADLLTLTAGAGASLIVKHAQNLEVAANAGATLAVAGKHTADQAANITLTSKTYTSVITGANIETLNIKATHTEGLTLGTLKATGKHVVLSGDSDVTLTASTTAVLDGAALTGRLVVDNAGTAGRVLGAQGDSSVTFGTLTNDIVFTGQAGHDTVSVNGVGIHRAILALGDGDNTVTATGVIAADGVLSVTAGDGNDTVVLNSAVVGTLVLDLGGGHNTLTLNAADIAMAKSMTLSGVNAIAVNQAATNKIAAKDVTGKTLHVTGTEADATLEVVAAATGDTIDLSNMTVSNLVGSNARVTVQGSAVADIITGTSGNDIIVGGAGADVLTGGAGADIFRFAGSADSSATATDIITDFVAGTDKIAFQGVVGFHDITDDGSIAAADSLADAVVAAFALHPIDPVDIDAIQFTYSNKVYFAVEDTPMGGATDALVVEVTGMTGQVTAANFITAL